MMKLLLAEDDLDDREFFHGFLQEREDLQLLPTVENGVDLLACLDNIPNDAQLPDAIILDHVMPKMDGLQTLKLLKESNRYSHIPVMMYTTYSEAALEKSVAELGAVLLMLKPTTEEGYNQMVDDFKEAIRWG